MSLFVLVGLIFLFNVMTFGNGPVMIPLLQTHLVDQSHVLTTDQLLYAFAIARVTPGQANVYVASIGYFTFGLAGSILATLAIMLPGYLMIPLLRGFERIKTTTIVKSFTRGLTTTSVGLILAATVSIGSKTLTNPVAWIIFPFTFVLLYFLKWNTLLSLGVASLAGFILHLWL
ncbi:MAG TPA: chromate transporter [Chloroflexia bacterium]|nr:chromate transporter [Chloroflexia bacterium]